MSELTLEEKKTICAAETVLGAMLNKDRISVRLMIDFRRYAQIRRLQGDIRLNQAFDPRYVNFGPDDFWLLAENHRGEAIATYCLRRIGVPNFFDVIRSLELWFSKRPQPIDPRFTVDCLIPPFGGEIVHGGGLWVRQDYRGASRLAVILPHLARAMALRDRTFDHDSAMIRDISGEPKEISERRATYMGKKVYGFSRVHCFVDGWFPPERRAARMLLCHSTRCEAIASLSRLRSPALDHFSGGELRKLPLVDQHNQAIHPPPILRDRQYHTCV